MDGQASVLSQDVMVLADVPFSYQLKIGVATMCCLIS